MHAPRDAAAGAEAMDLSFQQKIPGWALLGSAAAMVALAATLVLLVPQPREVAAPPLRRLSCRELAALLADGERREGELVVVEPERGGVVSASESSSAPALRLACDGLSFVIRESAVVNLTSTERSAYLVRLRASGALDVVRVCLDCDDVGEGASRSFARGVLFLELFLCFVALWALVLYRGQRPRLRLGQAFREAPEAAEGSPLTFSAARLEPLDGGPALAAEELASLELPPRDAPFRERPGPGPVLGGPARVNGLVVASGRSTPVADGDVIEVGGRTHRLRLEGASGAPLRYHSSGPDRLRFVTLGLWRWTNLTSALGSLTFIVIAGVVYSELIRGWPAPAALAAAGVLVVALLPSARRLRLEEVPASLERPLRFGPFAPGEVVSARLVDLGRGGYELILADRQGAALFVEHVPPARRAPGPAEQALRAALRAEAEELVRRLEALLD